MLRKRNERKRKNIALALMRDLQGSAATMLAIFEKMRAAGGQCRGGGEDAPGVRHDGVGSMKCPKCGKEMDLYEQDTPSGRGSRVRSARRERAAGM